MYTKFFGFKENPFMLAPNPDYLFLGKSHEEALAHLIYAVSEGEGFISLIGKRGVGKTTICQTFIDRRQENTEVAYIFKPEVSPAELLRTINSEFGIRSDTDDVKELTDALNSFLMQQRVAGKKVLLFIDDAQNLNADALEQVRLLSNLETTREKLLQIVLVGEPALAERLGSRALRQIGQRVSVSYYINPLTYEETCAYIYHRLSIASMGTQTHFEASALKRIYHFSGGIPRLVNMACNQSLAAAHRINHSHITEDIAQTAILELSGRNDRRRAGWLNKPRAALVAIGCCLLLILIAGLFVTRQPERPTVASRTEAQPASADLLDKSDVTSPPRAKAPDPVINANRPDADALPPTGEPDGAADPLALGEPPEADIRTEKPADIVPPDPVSDMPADPVVAMTHSVQVGAFRRLQLAKNLQATLRRKGYPATIWPVHDSKKRIWFTVRIGDYPSRDAAAQRANEFTSREKMESAVRPFEQL